MRETLLKPHIPLRYIRATIIKYKIARRETQHFTLPNSHPATIRDALFISLTNMIDTIKPHKDIIDNTLTSTLGLIDGLFTFFFVGICLTASTPLSLDVTFRECFAFKQI
jgi:hypothetical protein